MCVCVCVWRYFLKYHNEIYLLTYLSNIYSGSVALAKVCQMLLAIPPFYSSSIALETIPWFLAQIKG